MPFLRRLARWSLEITASLLSVAAFGGAVAWFFFYSSLSQTEGQITLPGLRAGTVIERDSDGIPHIRAQSENDAYFALGYVHAQDRLWQMEAMRRFGAGRLSEVLGPQTLGIDRTMRSLGLHHLATRIFKGLAPEVQRALIAYSNGVNSYLAHHGGAWPLEFYLFRVRPEPWTPADSLVWGQLMGLRLSGDWRGELARMRLARRLTPQQIEDLLDKPSEGPVTVEEPLHRKRADTTTGVTETASRTTSPASLSEALLPEAVLAEMSRLLPDAIGPHSASNSWVLSGNGRTATGKPLLANDPHLGLELPSTWYLARITAPGLEIAGATAPGVPFHILGHNDHIAWGFTNTGSDTQDVFIERTDPSDPSRYLTPDGPAPFAERQEIIHVRGDDDLILTVRETRHGPVISDLMNEPLQELAAGDVLAFASAGLRPDDRTAEALYRLNRAQNWDDFTQAMHRFHSPQQNISYADTDGNIGIYIAGRVPIRKHGEGLVPVPGWSGDYDWIDFVPPEELPQSYNPSNGRIANANNRVVGSDYPYPLGRDWNDSFRIQRIEEMIDEASIHNMASMARMQGDVRTLVPDRLLPRMLPALRALPLDQGRYAGIIDMLESWDGRAVLNRPQPLIFTAWLRELTRLIAADEIGDMFDLYWSLRPAFVADVLSRNQAWCDNVTTPDQETCDALIQRAFLTAMDSLATTYGEDPGIWRWGDAHRARLVNRALTRIPLINAWSDVIIPTPGDDATINRGTTSIRNPQSPFAHVHGPGLRAIYDLADLDRSEFIVAGGQSGNVLSPHYDNMIRRWRDVEYVTMPQKPDGEPLRRLVLMPQKP